MANITPTSSTLKDIKLRTGAIKGINPANPNVGAFKLVTHFVFFSVMQKIIPFFLLSTPPPRHHSLFENQDRKCGGGGGGGNDDNIGSSSAINLYALDSKSAGIGMTLNDDNGIKVVGGWRGLWKNA